MNIECKHLIVAATNDCFVKCLGCYNFWGQNKDIISTECIVNFLKCLDSEKIEKITVSGGDPLVRPDIIELLNKIKKLHYKINLDTVGTGLITNTKSIRGVPVNKIEPKQLTRLVDMIGIPLDGHSSNIVQTFRLGRSNLFQEQIAILETLNNVGANICINTVVHKQNINDIDNIISVIKKYNNVHLWQLFQYMPIGVMGYKNKNNFEISDKEFSEAMYRLSELVQIHLPNVRFNPKSKEQRKKLYLLIDTDGYAWTPLTAIDNEFWQRSAPQNDKRIILGNIKHTEDMKQILDFLYYGKLDKGLIK